MGSFHSTLAQSVLNLMSETDSLQIIAISNEARMMNATNAFLTINTENKSLCRQFIESLDKCGDASNHTFAFEYAFKWARVHYEGHGSDSMRPLILYVSRGYISSGNEMRNVLEAIATGQSRLKQQIVINTCAIALREFLFNCFCFCLVFNQIAYTYVVSNSKIVSYSLVFSRRNTCDK